MREAFTLIEVSMYKIEWIVSLDNKHHHCFDSSDKWLHNKLVKLYRTIHFYSVVIRVNTCFLNLMGLYAVSY